MSTRLRTRRLAVRVTQQQADRLATIAREADVPLALLLRVGLDAILDGRISVLEPLRAARTNRG